MAQVQTEGENDNNNDDNISKNNDDCIDLEPNEEYPWWVYTYNAKNKYFIQVQWKMAGEANGKNGGSKWRKYGARNITVNGKGAKLLSMNTKPHDYNDMSEYLRFKQGDKEFRYWYHKQLGPCLDDGNGVFYCIKRTNNGKMEEM